MVNLFFTMLWFYLRCWIPPSNCKSTQLRHWLHDGNNTQTYPKSICWDGGWCWGLSTSPHWRNCKFWSFVQRIGRKWIPNRGGQLWVIGNNDGRSFSQVSLNFFSNSAQIEPIYQTNRTVSFIIYNYCKTGCMFVNQNVWNGLIHLFRCLFFRVKDDRIGERVDITHEQDERDVPHVPLDIDDDVPLLQHLVDVNVDIGTQISIQSLLNTFLSTLCFSFLCCTSKQRL